MTETDKVQIKKEYYYGIDLLRLIAIFNIVVLHTLGRSGVLESAISSQHDTAWLIRTFAYSAVDIFGIVSGFVNYSDRPKPLRLSRLFELWLQVLFYGLMAVAVFGLFTDLTVGRGDVLTAMFPLLRGEYWFFSAYAGMFLFSGLINNAVRNTDNRSLYKLLAALFAATMVELLAVKMDTENLIFNLNKGYSCLWLIMMYFTGAVMRKTGLHKRVKDKKALCIAAITVLNLFSWIWMVFISEPLTKHITAGSGVDRLFEEYISPTITMAAVLTVALFANFRFGMTARKIIGFAAPAAFGIYLLNSQPLIAGYLYNADHLAFLNDLNYFGLFLGTIAAAAAFTVAAVAVDKLRAVLFRLTGITGLIRKTGNRNTQ